MRSQYSEKMVGYMACSLLLREGDDLLRLIINSIKVRAAPNNATRRDATQLRASHLF